MSKFNRVLFLLLGLIAVLSAGRTVSAAAGRPLARASVPHLVKLLSAADGWNRVESSAELLQRGPSVLPALERAGAKPVASVDVPRLDVIYSLLKGLPIEPMKTLGNQGASGTSETSFGIHVSPRVRRQDLVRMGQRYGFILPAQERIEPNGVPTCYVNLAPGKKLDRVLRDVISHEPDVLSVNLNYQLS